MMKMDNQYIRMQMKKRLLIKMISSSNSSLVKDIYSSFIKSQCKKLVQTKKKANKSKRNMKRKKKRIKRSSISKKIMIKSMMRTINKKKIR